MGMSNVEPPLILGHGCGKISCLANPIAPQAISFSEPSQPAEVNSPKRRILAVLLGGNGIGLGESEGSAEQGAAGDHAGYIR